jgi:hypothetical protein
MIEIYNPGFGLASGFLRASAGKKRTVEKGQLHLPGVIGNGDGKDACVLVVHVNEIDALKGFKGRQPDPFPVKQILRHRQCNPGSARRKRCVSHDIMLERLDKGNARIFTTTAAVRSPLIIGFRLKRNTESLNSGRIAGIIKPNPSNADAGKISSRDESRKQVKFAIRATSSRRIQDTLDLLRITWFRLHYQPQALQLKATHRLFSS